MFRFSRTCKSAYLLPSSLIAIACLSLMEEESLAYFADLDLDLIFDVRDASEFLPLAYVASQQCLEKDSVEFTSLFYDECDASELQRLTSDEGSSTTSSGCPTPTLTAADSDSCASSVASSPLPRCMSRSTFSGSVAYDCTTIRPYSPEERLKRVQRYLEKKTRRTFVKRIRYACRKSAASLRPRHKGRFIKPGESELQNAE
mmetsp:Transcript_32343/g.52260  ORF Transcript_32343/g.52260 Transcript_32343/m.52260 type:complete len:202 (-) Transcript_32343:802-1407(-)